MPTGAERVPSGTIARTRLPRRPSTPQDCASTSATASGDTAEPGLAMAEGQGEASVTDGEIIPTNAESRLPPADRRLPGPDPNPTGEQR